VATTAKVEECCDALTRRAAVLIKSLPYQSVAETQAGLALVHFSAQSEPLLVIVPARRHRVSHKA
jgi:hypothetical protein